jgi:hypothetical protein
MAKEEGIKYHIEEATLEEWRKRLLQIAEPRVFYVENFENIKTQVIQDSCYTAKQLIQQIDFVLKP